MTVSMSRIVCLCVCSTVFAIDLGGCGGGSGHPGGATDGGDGGDGGGTTMPMCRSADPAHFNVDVPSVTLSGAMTVNGQPLPAAEPFSSLSLRTADGDVIPIGSVGVAGSSAYGPTAIVAGSYDLFYSWNERDTTTPANIALPRNTSAIVQAGVMLTSSQTFNIDLPTITLNGVLKVNGAVPPAATLVSQIELRNVVTHDKLVLGQLGQASYIAKQILPGTYDVYYVWRQGDSDAVPHNLGALVQSGVALTTAQTFNVDVPMVPVSGNLTINGATVPVSAAQTIELRNSTTGDFVTLASAGSGHYGPVPVIPGTYDVYYHSLPGLPVAPAPVNGSVRLRTGVAITAAQTLDVDVPSVSVSGMITLNGGVPVGTGGLVRLVDPVTSDAVTLGVLGNYGPVSVVAGNYELHAANNAAAATPGLRNVNALLGTAELTASRTLNVDIPVITVSVTPTLNGAALSVPAGSAELSLQNPATGESIAIGDLGALSTTGALSVSVVPGSYEIYYGYLGGTANPPPAIPHNQHALVQAATSFTASGVFPVDIPMMQLSGAITVNGAAATTMTGAVVLRAIGAASGGVLLGTTGPATYSPVGVVPGVYSVYYMSTVTAPTSAVPSNMNHPLGCVSLTR